VPDAQRKAPLGKNQTLLLAALQEWQRSHPQAELINGIELRALGKGQGLPARRLAEAAEGLEKFVLPRPLISGSIPAYRLGSGTLAV